MSEQTPAVALSEALPHTTQFQRHAVQFTAQASEFFRIWIVNILLSIVTLGIYSAWAKVRTNQYLYSHTKIAGHAFRYLANPIQILKGRLIAVAVFAVFAVLSHFSPVMSLVLSLAMLAAFPWLMLQSLKFKLRMTAYRNVRFGFHGTYGGVFYHFILLPVLSVFTLYLALPYALKEMDAYVYNNISFGGKKASAELTAGTYYSSALMVIGVALIAGITVGILGGVVAVVVGMLSAGIAKVVMALLIAALYLVIGVLTHAIWKCRVRNYVFNQLQIEQLARFESTMDVTSYGLVVATNVVAVAFTAGLAYPWALIRLQKYSCDHTQVLLSDEIEQITDPSRQGSSAFAEEASDLYDVDFALT